MKKTLFPILALILAACASAPQVTLAPEATPTSTPPPTETPLPTLTPTPVAVDGIAENAEGDKLAFLNGEWRVLPELDADYASMRMDENGGVVAVDAEGEVAFEYDMAANNWVEVVREPEEYNLGYDKATQDLLASLELPENYKAIPGSNGLGIYENMGTLRISGILLKVFHAGDYIPEIAWSDQAYFAAVGTVLPDGTIVEFLIQFTPSAPRIITGPVNLDTFGMTPNELFRSSGGTQTMVPEGARFVEEEGLGEEMMFIIPSAGENSVAMSEFRRLLKGEKLNPSLFLNLEIQSTMWVNGE